MPNLERTAARSASEPAFPKMEKAGYPAGLSPTSTFGKNLRLAGPAVRCQIWKGQTWKGGRCQTWKQNPAAKSGWKCHQGNSSERRPDQSDPETGPAAKLGSDREPNRLVSDGQAPWAVASPAEPLNVSRHLFTGFTGEVNDWETHRIWKVLIL